MKASGQYETDSVVQDALVVGIDRQNRIDIRATAKGSHKTLLIECKTSPLFSARWVDEVAKQLGWFKTVFQNGSLVLAVATRVNAEQRNAFKIHGIDVWDLDEIARRFVDHLNEVEHPVLRPMLLGIASFQNPASAKTPEAALSEELVGLKAGKVTWSEYQRLIGRILERVFVPSSSALVAWMRPSASFAKASGVVSPAIKASIMRRPERPRNSFPDFSGQRDCGISSSYDGLIKSLVLSPHVSPSAKITASIDNEILVACVSRESKL